MSKRLGVASAAVASTAIALIAANQEDASAQAPCNRVCAPERRDANGCCPDGPRPTAPPPPTPRSPEASCPAEMAAIPGGSYATTRQNLAPSSNDVIGESHDTATVTAFCLDRTEVTVRDYAACLTTGACTAPRSHTSTPADWSQWCNWENPGRAFHPVNCVSATQAISYCASVGKRLPTEDEWEWAARNGPAATTYPWGNGPPDAQHVNACGIECVQGAHAMGFQWWDFQLYAANDGFANTAPVGSFPLGDDRFGIHDLAGNVSEWTSTFANANGVRALKGGDYSAHANVELRPSAHRAMAPTDSNGNTGFRCAK